MHRFAAGEEMYPHDIHHYAPSDARYRIEQHGLQPGYPSGGDFAGEAYRAQNPFGVYGWLDPNQGHQFGGGGSAGQAADIYKIPGGTLPMSAIGDHPIRPGAVVINQAVDKPELWSKFEDRVAWPGEPEWDKSPYNPTNKPAPLKPGELPLVQPSPEVHPLPSTAPAAPAAVPEATPAAKGFGAADLAKGLGKGVNALGMADLADKALEGAGVPNYQGKPVQQPLNDTLNALKNPMPIQNQNGGINLQPTLNPSLFAAPKALYDNTLRHPVDAVTENVIDPTIKGVGQGLKGVWNGIQNFGSSSWNDQMKNLEFNEDEAENGSDRIPF